MDFRYCPSCNQSVLDDEAVDCPFCGAPMSGEPGKTSGSGSSGSKQKSSGTKSGKPAKSAADKAAMVSTKASKSAKKTKTDDDDPFGVVEASAVNAIQATAKPGKGRLHKVVCPMCDCVCFVPKSAVGKEVRCSNQECMVPIFKAQSRKPKKPKDPRRAGGTPQPVEKPRSPMVLYGSVAAVMVVGGLAALWFFTKKDNTNDLNTPFDIPKNFANDEDKGPIDPLEALENHNKKPAKVEKKVSLAEQRDNYIVKAIKTAREPANRDKPFARRLTADAHALAGHFADADREIKQLERVDSRRRYFTVQPLARKAFGQLAAGDADGAAATLKSAQDVISSMPGPVLRTQMDMVTALSAVLISTGDYSAADALLKRFKPDDSLADSRTEMELSSVVSLLRELQAHGLDKPIQQNTAQWVDSRRTAAAGIALLNGFNKQAAQWTKQQSSDIRADCLSLCTELACLQQTAQNNRSAFSEFQNEVSGLSADETRLVQAVAARCLAKSAADESKAILAKILPEFMALEPPASRDVPGISGVLNYENNDGSQLRIRARTGREILTACVVTGQSDDARKLLPRSVLFAQAMAPPFVQCQKMLQQSKNTSSMTSKLKRELSLPNDSAARRQLRKYRSIATQIAEASESRRMELETLLSLAADNGLTADAWKFAKAASDDAIMDTIVPWSILDRMRADKQDPAEVISTYQNGNHRLDGLQQLNREIQTALAAKKPMAAAQAVAKSNATNTQRFLFILRSVLKYSSGDQFKPTMQFVKELKYPPFREEAIDLLCARAVQSVDAKTIQAAITEISFAPTERVAAYHGLAVGLHTRSLREPSGEGAAE